MEYLEAFILGIIQGLTEFLPVSSSGHLEIVKAIFKQDDMSKQPLLFTIVLHFATALATIFIYRKEVSDIFKSLIRLEKDDNLKLALFILVSMIPAASVGYFFQDFIASLFDSNLILVGLMLLFTALLLFLIRIKQKTVDLGYLNAFIIGIVQAVAILPGISRSGATICTAVILGIDRSVATRFSFLMVIPLIMGSMAKSIFDYSGSLTLDVNFGSLLVGFITAFITGMFACRLMIRMVKHSRLEYFAIYCVVIGVGAILFGL